MIPGLKMWGESEALEASAVSGGASTGVVAIMGKCIDCYYYYY